MTDRARPRSPKVVRSESNDMHPYHIKEFADERVASRLREARAHQLRAEAQAGQEPGETVMRRRGARFRIPLINWELRMQPVHQAHAGQ